MDMEQGKEADEKAETNPRDIVRSPSSVSTGTQVLKDVSLSEVAF